MYIVCVASSIPTSVPVFKKHSSKSPPSAYHSYRRHNAALDSTPGEDDTALTSFPMPPGRVNAYVSAVRDKEVNHVEGNGTSADIWGETGRVEICKTTQTDVTRDGGSEVADTV